VRDEADSRSRPAGRFIIPRDAIPVHAAAAGTTGRSPPADGPPTPGGHSSYAVTAGIYSHVGPAQQREAAYQLDEALRW